MGPLRGMKVLDLTVGDSGPFVGMQMGDGGADVIKIEPIGGDWARHLGGPFDHGDGPLYMGINRNKLTFGFKHLFGQTISEYCLENRLQTGWKLLQETEQPIAVVANQVGYAQAAAFSNAFRQHFGVTPTQVRRR